MSLSVSRIVSVDISVSPLALSRAGFGVLNLIGTSDVIPISERIRSYDDITGVAEDFATTDEEYIAASIYFSQSPRPTELYISRRAAEGTSGVLEGSSTSVETSISAWQAVTDGEFSLSIDGVEADYGVVNFSAVTSMDDVATIVDGAISSNSSCVWDGSKFVITSDSLGATSTVSFMTDNATFDYIGILMGCDATSAGATVTAGLAPEDIQTSLNAIEEVNSKWYGFAFTSEVRDDSQTTAGTQADCLDAAAWAEARVKTFWNNSGDADTLVTGNTDNISYLLNALGYRRTATVYSGTGDYPALSMFARGATVDFDGSNTTITYKFKQLPGISAEDYSATQANNLIDANCNYYANFGTQLSGDSVAILAEGVMAQDDVFADEVIGIDWLQNAIQTAVFNYLYQSTTKIPQTDEGVAGIVQTLAGVLDQAVENGLAAPGYVTIDNDEAYLSKGYEIFTGLVEDQSAADREAREAPPISFVIKGAGAIHSVAISGTFTR